MKCLLLLSLATLLATPCLGDAPKAKQTAKPDPKPSAASKPTLQSPKEKQKEVQAKQKAMATQQKVNEAKSNAAKAKADTAKAVINNLR